MHMQRADDLFGMPNGTPITDRIIEASISVGGTDHAENRQSLFKIDVSIRVRETVKYNTPGS